MLRKLALLLLPLALLAGACSSGGADDDGSGGDARTPTATAVSADGSTPTGASDAQPTAAAGDTDSGSGVLFGALNPLDLLSAVSSGQPSLGDADPSLQVALLTGDDLPGGFLSLGDFAYNVPSKYGELQMAASMFTSGNVASDEIGATVMSAVVAIPPDAMDDLGDPSHWLTAGEADLADVQTALGESGLGLSDLRLLDASGLGDGGVGMHMTLDFGALFGALGAPDEANPIAAGLSMDMYMFLRGDRMLMTIVMWPAGAPSGVDGRALAEIMDGRAASARASY